MKKFLLQIFRRILYIFVLFILLLGAYLLNIKMEIDLVLNKIIDLYNNEKYFYMIFNILFLMIIIFISEVFVRLASICSTIFYEEQKDIIEIKKRVYNIEKNLYTNTKKDKETYFLIKDKNKL